jgi:hypothetical protein
MPETNPENALLDQLKAEKPRLETAVAHLLRSIDELKAAIAAEGDADRAYQTAIEENIVVVAKYKARIERLGMELENLDKGVVDLGAAVAMPTATAAEAAAGGGGGRQGTRRWRMRRRRGEGYTSKCKLGHSCGGALEWGSSWA